MFTSTLNLLSLESPLSTRALGQSDASLVAPGDTQLELLLLSQSFIRTGVLVLTIDLLHLDFSLTVHGVVQPTGCSPVLGLANMKSAFVLHRST